MHAPGNRRGQGPRDDLPSGRAAREANQRGRGRLGPLSLPPIFDDETPAALDLFPCMTCRRGWIAVFERGTTARGRMARCPACRGTGKVGWGW
jgi:hypothetical protein